MFSYHDAMCHFPGELYLDGYAVIPDKCANHYVFKDKGQELIPFKRYTSNLLFYNIGRDIGRRGRPNLRRCCDEEVMNCVCFELPAGRSDLRAFTAWSVWR